MSAAGPVGAGTGRVGATPESEGLTMTKDSTGPALSNYLAVLAVEIAGEVAAYKRSSTAAHVAYLTAGAKLLDARENAPRGQWAPFLAACGGVEPRTARNMMALARAGLTADDVTAAGGVRAALESLRDRPQAETVSGNGTPGEGEKTETVSAIEAPAPGPMSVYQWRRARGLCVDCGEPSDGKARCRGHRKVCSQNYSKVARGVER